MRGCRIIESYELKNGVEANSFKTTKSLVGHGKIQTCRSFLFYNGSDGQVLAAPCVVCENAASRTPKSGKTKQE